VNDPFPDWISRAGNAFFIWWQDNVLDHLVRSVLIAIGLLLLFWLIWQYRDYREVDAEIRSFHAKKYSCTPLEERERNLVKVVDTAIASLSHTPTAVKEISAMTELDRRTAHLNLADSNNMSLWASLSVIDELQKIDPTVYQKLRFNITRIDAGKRTAAFADAQLNRMHVELNRSFAQLIMETLEVVEGVTDPKARKHMERFADMMLEQTAAGMGGTHLTAIRAMDAIVAEPYLPPPPPRPGFLEYLFGVES
jgi:hypothetical protein